MSISVVIMLCFRGGGQLLATYWAVHCQNRLKLYVIWSCGNGRICRKCNIRPARWRKQMNSRGSERRKKGLIVGQLQQNCRSDANRTQVQASFIRLTKNRESKVNNEWVTRGKSTHTWNWINCRCWLYIYGISRSGDLLMRVHAKCSGVNECSSVYPPLLIEGLLLRV